MASALVKLADECELITKGTTPSTLGLRHQDSGIPFIRAQNLVDGTVSIETDPLFIDQTTHDLLRRSKIKPSDILLSIAGTIGRAAIVPASAEEMNCNQAVAIIRPSSRIDRRFLLHWLSSRDAVGQVAKGKVTGTISNLSLGQIGNLKVHLPPLDIQRRIASILDKADTLRRKRKRALDLLDSLTQSAFLEMFGDPALNVKKYPLKTFREISEKMSDGPFGSNLKSSHYVDVGIRVIRLQNIGVGKFFDEDRAFISEDHFKSLSKHECLPGDVLVGTLGDPNLRACLQPTWLPVAINKADCVQIRPKRAIALPEYIAALINQPSVEKLAHGLMLGQTRTRISMGRLRELPVPIAPLKEQARFVAATEKISKLMKVAQASGSKIQSAFSALQDRAFSGELR